MRTSKITIKGLTRRCSTCRNCKALAKKQKESLDLLEQKNQQRGKRGMGRSANAILQEIKTIKDNFKTEKKSLPCLRPKKT
jgi:hypothetical protein